MSKNKKKKRRSKMKRPVLVEKCHEKVDIFTQEELPKNMKEIVVLNEKSPYHCVELDSFYGYWKSQAEDGKKVKNPYTNLPIKEKILFKIWRKIKKKYPDAKKPTREEVDIQYAWDEDTGMAVEVRQPRNIIFDERPGFMERRPGFRPVGQPRLRRRVGNILNRDDIMRLLNENDSENDSDEEDDTNFEIELRRHQRREEEMPEILRRNIEEMNIQELRRYKRNVVRTLNESHPRLRRFFERRIREIDERINQIGGGKKIKKSKRISGKGRKHRGIDQKTGKLKKGYKYSGKTLISGLPQIIKVKK